jgi:hypothetical protein
MPIVMGPLELGDPELWAAAPQALSAVAAARASATPATERSLSCRGHLCLFMLCLTRSGASWVDVF